MPAAGSAILPGDRPVFVKRRPGAPAGFFRAEASGLEWLGDARAVPVPRVRAVDQVSITVDLVPPGRPSPGGAEAFGRALADLHVAGAPAFGAPWAGFIGPLPMSNEPLDAGERSAAAGSSSSGSSSSGWADFFAQRRVLPFLRAARDLDAVTTEGVQAVERTMTRLAELAGPSGAEPPSRLHGDLWSGNLLWDPRGTAWVIDPAAHGGHRESDLAMLALFGAPHLDRIVAACDEHRPLADGWTERVGLHQLHPLLVHAVLFGPSYGSRAVAVARHYAGGGR